MARRQLLFVFTAFVASTLFCAESGSLFAQQPTTPNEIIQVGYCNALAKEDYKLARAMYEKGGISLATPCADFYGSNKDITKTLYALITNYGNEGIFSRQRSDDDDLRFLTLEYLKVAGGPNVYSSVGVPLFWDYNELLFTRPKIGRLLISAGTDFSLAIKAAPYGSDLFARASGPESDNTGMTLLMKLCEFVGFKTAYDERSSRGFSEKGNSELRDIVSYVVSKSQLAAKDAYGRTALHHCALHGNLAIARVLMVAGADAHGKDLAGLTPLDYAVARGENEMEVFQAAPGTKEPQVPVSSTLPESAESSSSEHQDSSPSVGAASSAVPNPTATAIAMPTPTFGSEIVQPPTIPPAITLTAPGKDLLADARAAAHSQRFSEARMILKELVKDGNADAMYELGRLIIRGEGGAQSFDESRHLWEQAAEKGHGESLLALAKLYLYGDGVKKSPAVAKLYIERARSLGVTIPDGLVQ